MKKLSTKWFRKWAKNANLNNQSLLKAVKNLEAGLSAPGLGNHLYKVRIKREYSGKSSGFRTIVVYKKTIKQFSYMDSEKMKRRILTKSN